MTSTPVGAHTPSQAQHNTAASAAKGRQPLTNPFGGELPAAAQELGRSAADSDVYARGGGVDDFAALMAEVTAAAAPAKPRKPEGGFTFQSEGARDMQNRAGGMEAQIDNLKAVIDGYEGKAKKAFQDGNRDEARLHCELLQKAQQMKLKLNTMSAQLKKRAFGAETIHYETELIEAEKELAKFLDQGAKKGHNTAEVKKLRAALKSLADEHSQTSDLLELADPFVEFDQCAVSEADELLKKMELSMKPQAQETEAQRRVNLA